MKFNCTLQELIKMVNVVSDKGLTYWDVQIIKEWFYNPRINFLEVCTKYLELSSHQIDGLATLIAYNNDI